MAAAERLRVAVDVAVTVGLDAPNPLAADRSSDFLTLDFRDPVRAVADALAFALEHPVAAVVGVDDRTALAAAAVAAGLGLPHNTLAAAHAARNKHAMREAFRTHGLRVPTYRPVPLDADVDRVAAEVCYPCVLKPLGLAASQGVIRADDPAQFRTAFRRVAAIIHREADQMDEETRGSLLVEDFIPGREVALEGLLADGELLTLALFDKPDPLDGPYFEETIYVTPSRLPPDIQAEITQTVAAAAAAVGLHHGPIHAELRLNPDGVWMLEVAGRSIGGQCARTLRFGTGLSLEELIIRQAMGLDVTSYEREPQPAGVMMIPIPRAGVLREVCGVDAARAVPDIEDVTLTVHPNQSVAPPPDGGRYLGFIFARAATPEAVEAALRAAHAALEIVITPADADG